MLLLLLFFPSQFHSQHNSNIRVTRTFWIVLVQRELILKVKLWIHRWIFVPIPSCGPGLWEVTETMSWWIQVAEMSFQVVWAQC